MPPLASLPRPCFAGLSAPSAEHVDDHELVRRMAAREEAALAALYDRWSTLVHSIAARRVPDVDDAAEVVEEVFWQAWCQSERYQEVRGGVSTWLCMLARSRAMDRRRTGERLRAASVPGDPALLAGIEAPDDPLGEAERAEVRGMVATALGALPSDQRETVELAYFRGMSQSEIAAYTGQPLGTVKTRARLALRKLRETLAVLRESPC